MADKKIVKTAAAREIDSRSQKRAAAAKREWKGILPDRLGPHQAEYERWKMARAIIEAGYGIRDMAKILRVSEARAKDIVTYEVHDLKQTPWCQAWIRDRNDR